LSDKRSNNVFFRPIEGDDREAGGGRAGEGEVGRIVAEGVRSHDRPNFVPKAIFFWFEVRLNFT